MNAPAASPAAPSHPETDTPLVSVMVPVYNVERYLPQCLDSILAQDYRNLDILLVDGGSTDGCGAMCDSYASRDPRVRVLHTQNHGLAAARNACLAHAWADLLLFVDADDWTDPNTVSKLVNTMLETGADMVCCRRVEEWRDGPVHLENDWQIRVLEGDEIIGELIQGNAIRNVAWGKLCRADALSGITYPCGYTSEDIFTAHLLCRRTHKAICLPDEFFHYRIRGGSISLTRSVPNLIDYWKANRQRQEDLSDVSNELQTILMENCVFAAFRTWCWLASCPREDRRAAREEIHTVSHFTREKLPTVLFGEFSLVTKIECIACTVPSMAVWAPLNLLVQVRRRLLNRMTPYE